MEKGVIFVRYFKTKNMKLFLPAILLLLAVTTQAQVSLSTSPYNENFDNLGTAGTPAGFLLKDQPLLLL